jgi:hypothetical protein
MPINFDIPSAPSPTKNQEPAKKTPATRTRTSKSLEPPVAEDVTPPLERIKAAASSGSIIVVGIDPGARYTGFCVRDNKGNVFISSTFRRHDDMNDPVEWAKFVVVRVAESLKGIEYDIMGVEGVTDPKGFKYGKKDALNPKDIIRTGIIVGALAISYPDAFIVRPRSNGDKPLEEYPSCLTGSRPASLGGYKDPGVNVRKHERSAYDVAEHALFHHVQSTPA